MTVFCACLLFATSAMARGLLRDAEIEHTLQQMSAPILNSAGIDPAAVRIFLINDDSINAFVAGGQNLFFHSGLLLKVDNAAMLMGVIAHEAGHISGAHLTQLTAASDEASIGALISTIIGAAAAIGGNGQLGSAIIAGGQNTAMRNLLSHYRGNEQQADQAGIQYLRSIGLSPKGMLDTFELLRRKERQKIGPSEGDPYLRTHPLTTDRIAALRSAVALSENMPADASPPLQRSFARLQAKLAAFLNPPEATFERYPGRDTSEAAHLARAVAHFRQPNLEAALGEMQALIAIAPNNGFNYDLLGQMLYEHGRTDAAIKAYEKANSLQPHDALILTDLGKSYLAENRNQDAVRTLEEASNLKSNTASTQRWLATAYGRLGQKAPSYLALAREAALQNEPDDMKRYALLAKEHAQPSDSGLLLKADDLIADAERLKDKLDD